MRKWKVRRSEVPIKIHNKEYYTVDERVEYFREHYPSGQLTTEIVSHEGGTIVMKATAYVDGKLIATGHAQEDQTLGKINGTSYVENCETSAIGRCLGFMSIGINGSIASADEVKLAQEQQAMIKEQEDKEVQKFREDYLSELEEIVSMQDKEAYKKVCREYKANKYGGRIHSFIKENRSKEMKEFHEMLLDEAQAKTEGHMTQPPA